MKPKELLNIAKRLFFVPKCVGCAERLSPIPENTAMSYGTVCFCESCRNKWESIKAEPCRICSNTADKCTCDPVFFKELQPNIPALCFYRSDPDDIQSKVIYSIKHKNNRELFESSLEEVNETKWQLLAHTFDLHHNEEMVKGNVMTEYEEKFSSMGNPICKMIINR